MQPGCSMRVDFSNVMLSNSPQHRTAGEKTEKMQQKGWRMMRGKKVCFLVKRKQGILGVDHLCLSVVLSLLSVSPKTWCCYGFVLNIFHFQCDDNHFSVNVEWKELAIDFIFTVCSENETNEELFESFVLCSNHQRAYLQVLK